MVCTYFITSNFTSREIKLLAYNGDFFSFYGRRPIKFLKNNWHKNRNYYILVHFNIKSFFVLKLQWCQILFLKKCIREEKKPKMRDMNWNFFKQKGRGFSEFYTQISWSVSTQQFNYVVNIVHVAEYINSKKQNLKYALKNNTLKKKKDITGLKGTKSGVYHHIALVNTGQPVSSVMCSAHSGVQWANALRLPINPSVVWFIWRQRWGMEAEQQGVQSERTNSAQGPNFYCTAAKTSVHSPGLWPAQSNSS